MLADGRQQTVHPPQAAQPANGSLSSPSEFLRPDHEVVDTYAVTDLALLAADQADIEASGDPGAFVMLACERAKAWLTQALAREPEDITQIVELRSNARLVQELSARKQLGHEAATPGLASAADDSTAVYLDQHGRTISRPGGMPYAQDASTGTTALACTPYSGKDNPHYSSGDVSGHGWWDIGGCSGATTAHVFNCLYEWYTDNSWRQKACSSRVQLRPGGGSGNRTTARARCNPTSGYISWRNHVDVDVDGKWDTGEWPYNQANVVCVVY